MARRKASKRRNLVSSIAAVATIAVICLVILANFVWRESRTNTTSDQPKAAVSLTGQMDTFTSAEHSISFNYPGEWSAEEIINKQARSLYTSTVTVKTANGRTVAVLSTGGQAAGTCPASSPNLDLSTFDGSKEGIAGLPEEYGYRYSVVRDTDNRYRTAYGITSSPENRTVKVKCPAVNVNGDHRVTPTNKALGLVSFGAQYSANDDGYSSLESAEAYMESEEYRVIRDMITSLSIDS